MPPKRLRRESLTPYEKADFKKLVKEFKQEQQIHALGQTSDAERPESYVAGPFRKPSVVDSATIVKQSDLRGPGASFLKALVGRDVYYSALQLYGTAIVVRAARELAKSRRREEKQRKEKLQTLRKKLFQKGLEPQEIERYRLRAPHRLKMPKITTRLMYGKKLTGRYGVYRYLGRKKYKFIKAVTGVKALRSVLRYYDHYAYIVNVANVLGLGLTEAKRLVTAASEAGKRDFKKFKMSRTFKAMPERKKKVFTLKRWMGATVAAIYALGDVAQYIGGVSFTDYSDLHITMAPRTHAA